MTIIRPMIGAARNFTAGKLVSQLKQKNIPYTRMVDDFEIAISYSDAKGRKYTYGFDSQNAKLIRKKRVDKDSKYETFWKNGIVEFSMIKGEKLVRITKTVSEYVQDFWHKMLHSKRQPYTFTEIEKAVTMPSIQTGYTKRVFKFPNTGITITDIIPYRSFTINYQQKFNTRYRNIKGEAVEKAIDFQIRRKN